MLRQDFSLGKIEQTGRLLVPHLLLLVLLMLNVVSLPLLPAAAIKPQFVLMVVYYWAIYRPTLLPPLSCFVLGLLLDLLCGMPPGVNALILVMTHWLVREQRRYLKGQSYVTIWAVFGVVTVLSVAVQWGLYGLASLQWSPVLPVFGGALISLFLFPFITLLLVLAHRTLPVASRPYP